MISRRFMPYPLLFGAAEGHIGGAMEGTIATPVVGAGRRKTAALAALCTLALASSALAADYREQKSESAGSVQRGAAGSNKATTESIAPANPFDTSGRPRPTPYDTVTGVTQPTQFEKLLVELINVERKSRGIKPVVWDGMLSGIARMHSADMRAAGRTSHNSTNDGASYGQRLSRTPYRASAAAENVAYNSDVVKAHRALMASPGHRRNILNPNLTVVGVAVMKDFKDDWVYVVEDFAAAIDTISDEEAARVMSNSLTKAHSKIFRLEEDKALSRRLDKVVDDMIESGQVQKINAPELGVGWALAFTALDPAQLPKSAIEQAAKAQGYGLAVQFRKTKKYPFGAYWAVLFLKGQY
jgi:uncharacterized protein YkwD